jgi:tetratricopeptide (TPR) repeat protein
MNWHAANSYAGLAQSLLYQGKVDEAYESLRESFRLAEEMNAPDVTVEAYCTLAEIQLAKDATVEAEESAQSAVKLATQIGVSSMLATAWRLTSASLLRQGKVQLAKHAIENTSQALKSGPDRIEDGRYHGQAMLIAMAENDREQALLHYKSAEHVFKELGAARDLTLLEATHQAFSMEDNLSHQN